MTTATEQHLLRIVGKPDPFVADELVEDRHHVLARGKWRHTEGAHNARVRYYGPEGWRSWSRRQVESVRPVTGVQS
jgi:hypothetical protein